MALGPQNILSTHEVTNQPRPRNARDLWGEDPVLQTAVAAQHGRSNELATAGRRFGTSELREAAAEARRDPPRLVPFDRDGARLDEVRFNAGYHRIMAAGQAAGYVSVAWDGQAGGHVTHAALVYLLTQLEPGTCCPLTMSSAAVPVLRGGPLADLWLPKLLSAAHDPAIAPVAEKSAVTLGMAMTEKQGGSDVRANTTKAEPDGDMWRLTGHKWFCSAPMSDGFLTLAQSPEGLSCFLVPRWLSDGRNAIQLMRLKDKLGNHANASAEIEYHGAWAHLVGELGHGVRTILEMVHHTRLDTAMAPAGLMRAALAEAHWWVTRRTAFQRRLIDQPLMRAVLADLVLDWEAATALGLRIARAFDTGEADLARVGVALAKYLSNKRCPVVVAEAMEVLGGMGYVEETPMPMLYREAPLNGIWEGSGNVICLDILRSLARDPATSQALIAEITPARGLDRRFDIELDRHLSQWPGLPPEAEARWFCERLAILLSASVMLRTVPQAVAEAYVATRVMGQGGRIVGALPSLDMTPLLTRLGTQADL